MLKTNTPSTTPLKTKVVAIFKMVAFWALFWALLFLVGTVISPFFPASWERFIYGIFGTLGAALVTWAFIRNEKQSAAAYGLTWQRDTPLKFLFGLAIGTGIFLLIILLLLSFSSIQLHLNDAPWNPWSLVGLLAVVPLALMEELAFRAYPFIRLNQIFGLRITQFIVAVAFAGHHIIQGWDVATAFLGPGTWALVFGLAAVWSKGIALPTGIHVALNVIQQLLGMKSSNYASVWVMEHPVNATAADIDHTNHIGLISQILVLLGGILLTEYYLRKKQAGITSKETPK